MAKRPQLYRSRTLGMVTVPASACHACGGRGRRRGRRCRHCRGTGENLPPRQRRRNPDAYRDRARAEYARALRELRSHRAATRAMFAKYPDAGREHVEFWNEVGRRIRARAKVSVGRRNPESRRWAKVYARKGEHTEAYVRDYTRGRRVGGMITAKVWQWRPGYGWAWKVTPYGSGDPLAEGSADTLREAQKRAASWARRYPRTNPDRPLSRVSSRTYGGLENWRRRFANGIGWVSAERDRDGIEYTAQWKPVPHVRGTPWGATYVTRAFRDAKLWLERQAKGARRNPPDDPCPLCGHAWHRHHASGCDACGCRTNEERYQPKKGGRCSCRPGVQRDNCAACEGTGWLIDFARIRARRNPSPPRLPSGVRTIPMSEVRAAHRGHWFDKDTIRFFGSRPDKHAYVGPGGTFFASKERPWGTEGLSDYGVYELTSAGDVGSCLDVDNRQPTLAIARALAISYAAGTRKPQEKYRGEGGPRTNPWAKGQRMYWGQRGDRATQIHKGSKGRYRLSVDKGELRSERAHVRDRLYRRYEGALRASDAWLARARTNPRGRRPGRHATEVLWMADQRPRSRSEVYALVARMPPLSAALVYGRDRALAVTVRAIGSGGGYVASSSKGSYSSASANDVAAVVANWIGL